MVWKTGDSVEVEWKGKWYKAEIVEANDNAYKIHYSGYADNFDESVELSRIRSLDSPESKADAQKIAEAWSWTDGAGNRKTLKDFHDIIQKHGQWLASGGQQGIRADLTNADLSAADLKAVNLSEAVMSGVNLTKADMSAAFLKSADLSGAHLFETTFLVLAENINLSGASIMNSKVGGILKNANLSKATFYNADLTSAVLTDTDLSGALISGGNFTNVFLARANLSKAIVFDGDWTDANLRLADVSGLRFEPSKNPDTRAVSGATNLEFITYANSPDAVTLLRNSLRESGFDDAQRKITYALKVRQNELRKENGGVFKLLYYYLNLIFFDWTVRYGMQPERALIIMIYLWLIFAVIYDLFIHFPGRSGIFLVKKRVRKNTDLTSAMRVRPRPVPPTKNKLKYVWLRLLSEWRAFRISLFYSATRALHLGYGGLDFGEWVRMLTKREYDLKPKHWSRTISGLQSLTSLYLLAIWLLTEFGNPFD
ncbi:MAG: pentapeptide repeat-containing protein [Pyrinomonadaceae bacterium]|nr:pentapeptide repeat-containing protein [Pyrinomonadaceae bacterium]